MESEQTPATTNGEITTTETVIEGKTSRRDLVAKGAVAAAIAAVATGALTNRVHATNGDTMYVGESHSATDTTSIGGGSTFTVSGGTSARNSSIYGTVPGTSSSHYGVRGFNSGSGGSHGAGVYGAMTGSSQSPGVGVYGQHTGTGAGDGVHGKSSSGYGVRGDGLEADFIASGSGRVWVSKASNPGPTGNGSKGMIARDSNGALWYCYASNKWRELAGASSAGAFHAITPARIYDSRAGQLPATGPKSKLNPADASRVIDCTLNSSGVPSTATAVVLNLTVANTTGLGNLRVYPNGASLPPTSSINYTPGVNIANTTTSGCGAGAKLAVKAGGSSGADFIIDIVGYYV